MLGCERLPVVSPESHEGEGHLRIAHLTTVDMSLALLLATELEVDQEAGHEVLGISAPGSYVDRVEALGVQHVPIRALTRRWNLRSDMAAFFELLRTLRRLKLDVLHTHNPKTGVMGRIAGRLAGVPVVVNTCHGLWARAEDPLFKRLFVYGAEALAIRFSDFELFQNADDANTLRRFLKPGRWKVVGNGIDLDRFQPDPEGRRRVRAELGVADDEILVGSIGRRVREKGLAEYAESADRLTDKAVFVWVGPEDDTDAAADVPHQDALRFVGERTDMPSVYSALDVFVLASYREGFSRASMEAAASGVPMVLTDIRGCREIGTDNEHLLLVPPRDAAALTDGIGRLLDDTALRARLGTAARARARTEFDQRRVAQDSLDTYQAVTGGRVLPLPAAADRINVLHVLPHDQARGAQVYAGQLRDALRGDPHQEHLVVTLFDKPVEQAKPDISLRVPSGVARRVMNPLAVSRLRRLVRDRNPGAVVAHGGESLKYVIPAARTTPTIYYKVGLSSAEVSRWSRTLLYGALSRRATHVVGVSSPVAAQIEDDFGVPVERLSIIPNGRDPEIFHPAPADDRVRARPLILWVGQLEPGKRPELFLDVVDALRAEEIDFDAAIVGEGPLRAGMEERAGALGVSLLGSRADVPDLLREASVLVFTSAPNTEGMPGVLVEAGLTGLPVVSTPAAGVADVVAQGDTGLIAETVSDLTGHLVELLTDPGLRARLGAAARARCIEEFTVASTAGQWRDLVALVGFRRGIPGQQEASSEL